MQHTPSVNAEMLPHPRHQINLWNWITAHGVLAMQSMQIAFRVKTNAAILGAGSKA
jgi:hypothetical protein